MNPPVALSHICTSLEDLLIPFPNKSKININTSAQPNSAPHLGTITTIFCAFSLAKMLRKKMNKEVDITFDILENAPGKKIKIGEDIYQKMLKDVKAEFRDISLYQENKESFMRIINFAERYTEIKCNLRTYQEFQETIWNRDYLFKALILNDELKKIVNPNGRNIHVRIPCPTCGLIEKSANSLSVKKINEDVLELGMYCPYHGQYNKIITRTGNEFVDTGTSVRDVVKIAGLAVEADKNNTLSVMVDGADWAGTWSWLISMRGSILLGAEALTLPIRYFTPSIVDHEGKKFSKSIYVESDTYSHLPRAFLDSNVLIEEYGESVLEIIFDEVDSWIQNPSAFFRNYTINHIWEIIKANHQACI
ncbi:hypothetical protein ACSHU8_13785 [Acinetobacter baumannii]|uniref:hypothetical protein n=1 Tax=Acinetobacter baumannii TaxID=470 RepID=UPI0023406E21|nr:hypothetical protein [Acinetobacter baumannii]